jgi:hypothetical protein
MSASFKRATWYGAMAWAIPQYTPEQIDAAGQALIGMINGEPWVYEDALGVINNFRSSHSFPLNTFQVGLRKRTKSLDRNSLVAQRIKRLSSIDAKLQRFGWLRLSQMLDIGGCRAVMNNVRSVDSLVRLYKTSNIKHLLDDEDDYIRSPKKSGYRGYHLIYRYYSDRKDTYNNLKIEMQFRSQLQHAWATAVETVGTFIRQALKSSQGEAQWLRFFALMGSGIALRERTALVPGTPDSSNELINELRAYIRMLDVERRLHAYGATLNQLEQSAPGAHYFLLALDPSQNRVTITGFTTRELSKAANLYLETEKSIKDRPGAEAVLVSVESLDILRRAYPNYFLDTKVFIEAVKRAVA